MSPPGVPAQLRQLIHYHLDNGFGENALFLAGRLHALDPRSQDAAHLLALCNLRLGRYKAAHDYAKPKGPQPPHLGCAYVFAQACLALERHEAGAAVLEKARGLWAGRSHWSEDAAPGDVGDAEGLLTGNDADKHNDTSRHHLPDAAACFCLLGKLWAAHGDSKKAVDYYIEALRLNPFMWDAFTDLCDIGAFVRPLNIFKVTPEMLAAMSTSAANQTNPFDAQDQERGQDRNPFVATPDIDPFNPSHRNGSDVGLSLGGSNLLSRLNGSGPVAKANLMGSAYTDVETPTSNGNGPDDHVMMGDPGGPVLHEAPMGMPPAPGRKPRLQAFSSAEEPPRMRHITSRARLKASSEAEATEIPRPNWQNGHKRTVSGHSMHKAQQPPASTAPPPTAAPPRRSVRLLNSISSQIRPSSSRPPASNREAEAKERRELRRVKATGTKGRTGSLAQVGRVVSGNRNPKIDIPDASTKPDSRPPNPNPMGMAPPPKMGPPHEPRDRSALDWLLGLLLKFGTGYAQLSRYQCAQALETFNAIPIEQRDTPWVLAQMGKAYYERTQYLDAEKVFLRIREKAPSYLEDMEVFSNVLWHMKKDTDLAYLAHSLIDQDRLSPQAWCALGNAFSLQREHDQAIKCFTRATQLDPKFAYAFTLQGHEHVTNEEYDKAMFAYRCAISADNRHYNGWYGLGQVYERMDKFDVAEKHFRAAAQINPTNALLATRIGSMLDRMRKTQPALQQYMTAVALDPRSMPARFKKALLHLKLGQTAEALLDLEYLRDSAPDESRVHFYLGKTYKRLGMRPSALRHFTIALNLDPTSQLYCKQEMENLEGGEEEGEGGWSSEEER